MAPPTVLVVGHTTHDRVGDDVIAGGSVLYGARVHRALGADVRVLSRVGRDFRCHDALAGLETHLEVGAHTTTFTNIYDARGHRRQLVETIAPPILPEDIPRSWRGEIDVVHLAPVFGELELRRWIEALGDRCIGLDVQGWLRERRPGPDARREVVPARWDVDDEALAAADVACLSDRDIRGAGGDELVERLRQTVSIVALTHGARGATVTTGDDELRVGIHPAEVRDLTGAGDAFAAGLLFGLTDGRTAREAARLGAACASIIIEGEGLAAADRVGTEAEARAGRVPMI